MQFWAESLVSLRLGRVTYQSPSFEEKFNVEDLTEHGFDRYRTHSFPS